MKLLITTQKVDKNDSNLGFFHDWICEFAQNCEKVIVICLFKGEYDLPDNVRVISLGKEKSKKVEGESKKIINRLVYIFRFYKYIFKYQKQYDNVFVHMLPEYVVLGGIFWKVRRKNIGLWFMHKSVMPLLKIAEKFVNVIFTGSKDSCRVKSEKIKVVGHGIDVVKFYREERSDIFFKILSIGRITPRKDVMTFFKALKILNKENKLENVKVEIAGGAIYESDEIYLEELKSYVNENNLSDIVRFLGPIPADKRYKIFAEADLLVHTSNTGSLDKVVLEAMASECLVVSCNDSSKEVLQPFGEKFVFESKDYKKLAKKIEIFFTMKEDERKKMGEEMRNVVIERHGLPELIKSLVSFLK